MACLNLHPADRRAKVVCLGFYRDVYNYLAIAEQDWQFAVAEYEAAMRQFDSRQEASVARFNRAHQRRRECWTRYWELKSGYRHAPVPPV